MFAGRWIIHRYLCKTHWQCKFHCLRYQRYVSTSAPSISPALLGRARALAAEHAQLAQRLNSGYDVNIAKKAGSLNAVVDALKGWEEANRVSFTASTCNI